MNQIKSITMLLLMIIVTSSITAFAAASPGHLDSINGSSIDGWAWNPAKPEQAVEVTVTITNQQTNATAATFTTTASSRREDLSSLNQGTGNYGFQVVMDWSTLEDGTYLVTAYTSGEKLANPLVYQKGEAVASGAMRSLGVFKTTAYCPCYSCSEGWGRQTSTGALARSSHTIAVDPRVIPYGSKIMMNGTVYTAEDRGGSVKGNHIDVYYNTHRETQSHGVQHTEVYLIP